MNLLAVLIIGGLVGWLAARVAGRNEGIFASIVIGIIGSLVSKLFTGSDRAYLAFSWMGAFWSFVGALILVFILNAIQHRSTGHQV
jgi:uncharacterized membrane protein YeaQ/YmgE (transglycosylase-associated protein family)